MDIRQPIGVDDRALLFEAYMTHMQRLEWEEVGGWHIYPCKEVTSVDQGSKAHVVGEIHAFNDAQAKIRLVKDRSYRFQLSQRDASQIGTPEAVFEGTTILFCTSGVNSGHFLSEIISFAEFYAMLGNHIKVAIPQTVQDRLPFMYQILRELCPGIRLVPLVDNTSYQFERLVTRRNRWFTFLTNWRDVQFTSNNGVLRFESLLFIVDYHSEPLHRIRRYVFSSYYDNNHIVKHSTKLFLVKTSSDAHLTTPNRCLAIDQQARELAENKGFELINISEFMDSSEYVCTLRRATHIVFSYGAITCSNRFFLNPEAFVVLLANDSYAKEHAAGSEHRHIRKSHLCPVRSQRVILDFPDFIDETAMRRILTEFDGMAESCET